MQSIIRFAVVSAALAAALPAAAQYQSPYYGQGQGSPYAQQQQLQQQQQQGQGQMSDAERRMRIMLMQRAMGNGFGGIFRPAMDDWMRSPSADPCGGYSDSSARNACKNNDTWAADRLQQNRSTGSERAWYGGGH